MKTSDFKNLIKEAVREVVKEELKVIKIALREHNNILQPYKKVGTVQSSNIASPKNYTPTHTQYQTTGNPMLDILNETRIGMTGNDWNDLGTINSSMAHGTNSFIEKPTQVGTVGDMLSNSSVSSDLNQIEIDVVPNFSELMGAMKERGTI
jgi:hypothetical protein